MDSNAFTGEIRLFSYERTPEFWLPCHGQVLQTKRYPELFAIIGYTFGGKSSTFALPSFGGQFPMGAGTRPGGTARTLGVKVGQKTVRLDVANIPPHDHVLHGYSAGIDKMTSAPSPRAWISRVMVTQGATANPMVAENFAKTRNPAKSLHPDSIAPAGGNAGHDNAQPYLALSFCICCVGVNPAHE